MWQTAQEGYNDGGGEQHQRALAIASTSNDAAATASPSTSSSSSSPEDAAFADVLAETMQGHLSPAEAVREYALICERAADAARREAQGLGGGPGSGGAAAAAAAAAAARSSALESEAATWRLLSWLHGDADPCVPAGGFAGALGGGARAFSSSAAAAAASASPSRLRSRSASASASASAPSSSLSSLTGAQRAALAVALDPTLNRLGRVVAWLEASARRALAADDEGAAVAGGVAGGGDALLFPGDGLPRDTGLRTSGTGGFAELDPDAGTRALLGAGVAIGTGGGGASTGAVAAQAAQHWSRADDEASARLCSRLRCLLRAGRGGDAAALCARVGAHWRGVSLGSASGPGLVALGGEAAEPGVDADGDESAAADAADALAAEADLGAGALRALWRSAAAAAAAAASATAAAAPPGSAAAASAGAEAALYGVLGGDPAAALLLLGGDGRSSSASDFSSSSALPARPSPWHDALWVLARCWLEAEVDAVVSSSNASTDNGNNRQRCEGVVAGSRATKAWPPRHLADVVPRSPGELLSAAAAAAAASSSSRAFGGSHSGSGPSPLGAAEAHRGAQEALVAGGEALLSFVADRLPRWAGAGGAEDEAAAAAGRARPLPGGGGGARFAAHFALALADLRLIPDPADPLPPPAAARRVVDAANAAIALHCVSLIDCGSGGSSGWNALSGGDGASADFAAVVDAGSLLPPLAARAAAPFRRDIIGLRLRTLRDAPAEDAARALEALDQWLQGWASTAASAAAAASSSCSAPPPPVVSDIAPGEMERHAAAAAAAGRSAGSSREGPAGRAEAARWLWLSPRTLPAAAEHSCRVLRELFLSGGGAAAAAARALLAGLPAEPARVVELSPSEILAAAEELLLLRGRGRSPPSPSSQRALAALAALAPGGAGASSLRRGTLACLAELAAWRALFLADRAWRAWRADYAAVEAGARGPVGAAFPPPAAGALARLRAGAEALAGDLPALVASGWLQSCVGKGDSSSREEGSLILPEPAPDGEPGEVVLELLLELLPSPLAASDRRRRGGGATDEETSGDDDDSRYRLSSPEACAAGAAALSASLSAALPEGVVATAAPAEGADSGLVAVRVRLAEGGEGASAVAAAASAAVIVKGALAAPATSSAAAPPPPRVRVACLRATSGDAARALCSAVALPALLLRAAAAREAAVALGSRLDPGTAAVELAADSAIAPLFSRGEVQSLLERERRAVISAMVNDEARNC